jgi:hypothetical protein
MDTIISKAVALAVPVFPISELKEVKASFSRKRNFRRDGVSEGCQTWMASGSNRAYELAIEPARTARSTLGLG